jgi:hypothetical protein
MNFHIWKELLGYYSFGCYSSTTDPIVEVKRRLYMGNVVAKLMYRTTGWKVKGSIPFGVRNCSLTTSDQSATGLNRPTQLACCTLTKL